MAIKWRAQRQGANAWRIGRYHRCGHQRYADPFTYQRQRGVPVTDGDADIRQRQTCLLRQQLSIELATSGSQDKRLFDQFIEIYRLAVSGKLMISGRHGKP